MRDATKRKTESSRSSESYAMVQTTKQKSNLIFVTKDLRTLVTWHRSTVRFDVFVIVSRK